MSFGFEKHSRDIHQAVNHAYANGVVMLAAASNDGVNPRIPIAYPARQLGTLICINAADCWGNKAAFNPPAAAHRDNFSILGENVSSTWPENVDGGSPSVDSGHWKRQSGTSVATAIAASVAVSLIQFKKIYEHTFKLQHQQRLESFNGIRQLFERMTLDNRFLHPGDFDNIRPWEILDYDDRKREDRISGKIAEELDKI